MSFPIADSAHTDKPYVVSDFLDVAQDFSHILMDVWGVLHGGDGAFEHAHACLRALHQANKQVYLFSNAPRTSQRLYRDLEHLSFERHLFKGIITSGEEARHHLLQEKVFYAELGKRFYHVGDEAHDVLHDTDFQQVPLIQEASFVLLTGPKKGKTTVDVYEELWGEALSLALPVVCVNPDPYVIIRGHHVLCAGSLGALYAEMGGTVFWHGKPYESLYMFALEHMNVPPKQVLAVGDSMWTDIKGACDFGLKSMLITETGVHQGVFVENHFSDALEMFLQDFSYKPDFAMKTLATKQMP